MKKKVVALILLATLIVPPANAGICDKVLISPKVRARIFKTLFWVGNAALAVTLIEQAVTIPQIYRDEADWQEFETRLQQDANTALKQPNTRIKLNREEVKKLWLEKKSQISRISPPLTPTERDEIAQEVAHLERLYPWLQE